jgi:hypothetical protein
LRDLPEGGRTGRMKITDWRENTRENGAKEKNI